MRPIGFSTGALARGDFAAALRMLANSDTTAIELSALRDNELRILMEALPHLHLERFTYVSIHIPSRFKELSEEEVVDALAPCITAGIPLVVHPDVIQRRERWHALGASMCIENMDRRKSTGRSVVELRDFFAAFPQATFCLDLAHARQIDPTMTEARQMLREFRNRLRQVHISEIDIRGHHWPLSNASIAADRTVAKLIPSNCPIIIESMIQASDIDREIMAAQSALSVAAERVESESCDWGELA